MGVISGACDGTGLLGFLRQQKQKTPKPIRNRRITPPATDGPTIRARGVDFFFDEVCGPPKAGGGVRVAARADAVTVREKSTSRFGSLKPFFGCASVAAPVGLAEKVRFSALNSIH